MTDLERNSGNIVLTGLARSGTTLTCQLLNKLPNTVALVEPISPGKFEDLPDHEAVAEGVERYFNRMRRMALRDGQVISKHIGGEIPDNTFTETRSEDDKRGKATSKGKIEVGKDLGEDFSLVIKQPGMFSALLPALAKRFPCYATVRNPLSVMASGDTIRRPARRDRAKPPALTRYEKNLASAVAAKKDPLERRFYLLSWHFEQFQRELPKGHVIRYEDLVGSGGRALSVMVPSASELDEPLSNKNLNDLYDREDMLRLGERLLQSEGAYWDFYSRSEVEEILAQIS